MSHVKSNGWRDFFIPPITPATIMTASSEPESITLSVFISSPGDLESTRARAREVIVKMSGMVIGGRRVIFEPMLYEDHTPALVGFQPQQAVDYFMGRADQMDIYVGMLWSRMGSNTVIKDRHQRSGTRYEFDTAYKGLRLSGRPWMLLYRCSRVPPNDSDLASQSEVADFFDGFRGEHPQFNGFPQSFVEDEHLATLLTRDLEIVAKNIIRGKHAQVHDGQGQELAELVTSVRKWLATFEDLFGKGISENQERERDRLFGIHFKPLADPECLTDSTKTEVRPKRDESLLDVFDAWGARMVMVGERGTGKTFTMLKLMQDLADRAFIKRGEPVPVFFNLSSWSETYNERARPPSLFVRLRKWLLPQSPRSESTLDQWLEDQLVRNYAMQRKAARRLLGHNKAILCLDGLDELTAGNGTDAAATEQASRELRDACVRAINTTLKNSAVRMVLCCREDTFHELTCKPQMGTPLQTQLLTAAEVFDDLRHWPRLAGLMKAMEQSTVLLERARVALFLGMMRVAYEDMEAAHILKASFLPELEWEKHLLDHYVDRCMRLAPPESLELNKDLVPKCLSWMAQMPDNDFLLDDLQPSLLRMDGTADVERQWRHYRRFSVVLLTLSLMILETIPTGLSQAITHGYQEGWWSGLTHCLMMWGTSALILTPLYLGAFSARGWIRYGLCFGLAWALTSAACIYLAVPGETEGLDGTWQGAWHMFRTSLPCACIFFMLMGVQFFERQTEHKRRYSTRAGIEWHEIQPIEPMNWCWFDAKSYWRGGWIGFVVGPLVLVITWMAGEGVRGTIAALIITMLVTMFSGLSGTALARVSIEPNQGIARSLRHALFMTGTFVAFSSMCWGIILGLSRGWIQGLGGACMGLTLSFAFYVFGGWSVIQQFCLGSILHQEGKLPTWLCWPPWKATVQFLDDLVRYKLLRRSAGGYMFRHQSLRDYYRHLSEPADAPRPREQN
jgi:hypothetical protein